MSAVSRTLATYKMEFFVTLAVGWKLAAKCSFLKHILSKTVILIKLTKSLVIVLSSLWTRCSTKNIYM